MQTTDLVPTRLPDRLRDLRQRVQAKPKADIKPMPEPTSKAEDPQTPQ